MTKYILNSGGIRNHPDRAKEFFAEILKDAGEHPRLLICYFAQPREEWEKRFLGDQQMNFFPEGISAKLELAFPEKFVSQIKNSDAIYIHGGDDHLVQYWLKQFDIPRVWGGKVIAANSAGSHALVKHFWTCDWRELKDGLGILPIKFLAHYQSDYGVNDPRGPIDWEAACKQLEEYGDKSLPLYALREGEYIVIEQ